jgi:CheY-like chemotaxis protein
VGYLLAGTVIGPLLFNTTAVSQILERSGYRVTVHTSSVEALELFRSKSDDFDLVLTDMTMPDMTGDELAMELIALKYDIPVILCTGYSKKITACKGNGNWHQGLCV